MKLQKGGNMNKMWLLGLTTRTFSYVRSVLNHLTFLDGNITAASVVQFNATNAVNFFCCHLQVSTVFFTSIICWYFVLKFFFIPSFFKGNSQIPAVPTLDDNKDKPSPPKRLTHAAFHALKRTGSTSSLTSLTSLIDADTGEGHIRVCYYCKQVKKTIISV